MSLLSIKNLSVNFKIDSKIIEAVRDVSFDVNKGETVGIVGESGSGKSVTALSVMRLLPYPKAFHPTGKILFNSHDIMHMDPEKVRKIRGNDISMIFQEPMTSLNPLHTVEKQIGEVLELHKSMTGKKARNRIIEVLEMSGFKHGEEKLLAYPHQLSGGQRQRVMIAMALACEPKLLIADEPTTALDVTIQAKLLKLLRGLQKDLGMAMMLITHDLKIVEKVSDRVVVMKDGKIQEINGTREIFANPHSDYTKHLLSSEPKGEAPPAKPNAPIIIRTENLRVAFPIHKGLFRRHVGDVIAVDAANLTLKQGHTLGIVGESGSGKTTLAMAILNLQKHSGIVEFKGQNISDMSRKQLLSLRRSMQIVFQDPYGSLSPRMSVTQIVGEGIDIHKLAKDKAQKDQMIAQILSEVGLDESAMNRYPHEFSGGQRQRISIARAAVMKPSLLILDEPTSALDRSIQSEIIDLLRGLQQKYQLSYMFISHDLAVVKAMAHDVIVMKDGKIVEYGSTQQIFTNPQEKYTQKLIKAAFDLEV